MTIQKNLLPERLRALFHAPCLIDAISKDKANVRPLKAAAVLFPIILHDNGLTVLLTRRNENLKDHPGQISFPGGGVDADDLSAQKTALREAHEEIGLIEEHVEILGCLPEYCTGTGFRITPVVALVSPPFTLHVNPQEVAEVFEVPIDFLLEVSNYQQYTDEKNGKLRHFLAITYGEYFIWGATAAIINNLLLLLGLTQQIYDNHERSA